MKILFLNPVGVMGGGERVLLNLLSALQADDSGLQLHLMVGTDGPLVAEAEALGVQVQVLPLPAQVNQLGDSGLRGQPRWLTGGKLLGRMAIALPGLLRYLNQFRRTVRALQPDLVHSNGIKTHLLAVLGVPTAIPVVWHLHDFYGSRPLMAQVLRRVQGRAKAAIAISEAVAADARATLPGLPIQVIYNTVDVERFVPAVMPTPATLERPIRVGLVATYARWKGQDIFLEAAAALSHAEPELQVRFYIVGGPIYKTQGSQFSQGELQQRAADLRIADRVEFWGFREQVVEVYHWLDLVVHASTQPEPFGLVIIEAMACGKPVIVAQAGGAAELLTQGHDAIGVPPGNAAALAGAIKRLVKDAELRDRLGCNARSTVVQRFNQAHLGQTLRPFYAQFLPGADPETVA